MAASAVGLKTHIWNNNAKSILLLLGFPVLLIVLLWLTWYLFYVSLPYGEAPFEQSLKALHGTWHIAVIAAFGWFSVAYFFHTSMINAATNAHYITRNEAPDIYNMLENLCISRGMTMPKLAIIDTPMLNAFASGISDKTYTVTLTTGLIKSLDNDELEAVIAHELTHIINRDVRMLIVSVVFVGMISFAAEMAFRSMFYGRNGRGDNRLAIIAFLVLIVGYVFAMVIRFAISRKREYLADAGAVELTKSPESMIRALKKISGRAKMDDVPAEVAQMCIENPPASFFGMFATHPPIEKRIAALISYAGAELNDDDMFVSPWNN